MDAARGARHFFTLTSLQIGDMQSYLSHLTLFLVPESNKFLILVDNKPWLLDNEARPTHFWQLMVTKYRSSPFANRVKPRRQVSGRFSFKKVSKLNFEERKKIDKWFSLIDDVLYQRSIIFPVKKLKNSWLLKNDLQQILYGYIVFEVSWDHVRGINYYNELQTDTSMAIEAKLMKRWEFDSISQASRCISSWFGGTSYDRCLLQKYLDNGSGEVFYDAQEGNSVCSNSCREKKFEDFEAVDSRSSHVSNFSSGSCEIDQKASLYHTTPPPSGSYKRRKLVNFSSADSVTEEFPSEAYTEVISSPSHLMETSSSHTSDNETEETKFEPTYYKDVLILFRFDDPDLPSELKKVIVSDLRLLRLLEYGLPSWVLFLQSYPGFCRLYRPWMCSFARILFVLVSLFTVLIGFYDLYKNVPILRAAASSLCGPFFEWVESWEMASRMKYLGTMLFLHHFEKAVAWFLMISRAVRSFVSIITRPFAGPLVELMEFIDPIWNACADTVEALSLLIWSVIGSACNLSMSILNIMLWPFRTIVSVAWTVVNSIVYPLFWILGEILGAPVRIVMALANSAILLFSYISNLLRGAWLSVSGMLQLASATEVTTEAYEVSMWRSLWNDIFSQVIRAIRSILYGLIAFFTACNRHRLSIYNHIRELFSGNQQDRLRRDRLRRLPDPGQVQRNRTPTFAERKPNSPRRHISKHYKKKLA